MEGIEACRLVNLPDELLQMIISYLNTSPDSLNLAYTCRRLCTVALPHVYSTITFKKLSTRLLSVLVHTLLRHPTLARAVRSLTLMNEDARHLDERLENNYEVITFDPALITPIINAACRSSTSRITWEEDLKSGVDEDPWLGLLLPFLPKLEKLHVDYFYEFLHQFKMIDHRARRMTRFLRDGPSSLFESLTEVSVMNVIPFDDPPETLVLFRLPHLRKFIGDQVVEIDNQFYPESEGDDGKDSDDDDYLETLDADSTDDDEDDDDDDISPAVNDDALENALEPQGYSTVTHIHFKRSISDFSFRLHILACTHLQSFIYEYYNSSDCDQFDPASVHSYLVEHCNTLEDLALVQSNDNKARAPNNFLIPSLANFTALKRLWLRAPNLLGHNPQFAPKLVDRLPSTLEALWITDFDAADQRIMVEQLKAVASAARTRFPRLRQMTVECTCRGCKEVFLGIPDASMPENGGESQYVLYGPCREAGIELRVTDLVFPLSVRKRSID